MSVSIQYFRELYQNICIKANVGNTITTDGFNQFVNQSVLQLMSEDYQTFFQTKVVTNFLQSFLTIGVPQAVPPLTGLIPYPPDLQYVSSASHYYNGMKLDCELTDSVDWDKIQVPNSLEFPTARFTKYRQINNGLEFAPKNIGIAYVNYFSTPAQAKWGYTIVSNRQVYDPTTSVDIPCDTFNTNRLMAIFLQMIGVGLKDSEIAGFANEFTKETAVTA